jgi:hypothetical protein
MIQGVPKPTKFAGLKKKRKEKERQRGRLQKRNAQNKKL